MSDDDNDSLWDLFEMLGDAAPALLVLLLIVALIYFTVQVLS